MSVKKNSGEECKISLKVLFHSGEKTHGISLAFETEYLTVLALVASVVSFISLASFIVAMAYTAVKYLDLGTF